jgi:hypothetical protein
MPKLRTAGLTLLLLTAVGTAAERPGFVEVPRRSARDLKADFADDDRAIFSMPAALSLWGEFLCVADAREGSVKLFSKEGTYLGEIGRAGRGPGEFDQPSSLAGHAENLFVADAFNHRVQVMDAEGRYRGGFKLTEYPNQLVVLGQDRVIVSHHPSLPPQAEKLVRCYDGKGALRWEIESALVSSDAIYDLFRNQLVLMSGEDGTFFIAHKCDNAAITRYDGEGRRLGRVEIAREGAPRTVALPLRTGRREVTPICWDCAFEGGRFFVLLPEFLDGRDIGPGRIIRVIDGAGRPLEEIALPDPVKRIRVEGDRIYAFDAENALRIFEVIR